MTNYKVFVKIVLFVVLVEEIKSEDEIVFGFNDRVSLCADFDNDFLRADALQLAKSSDGDTDTMALAGSVKCMKSLGEGDMFGVEIGKETDTGNEPLWSFVGDLCSAIKDKDAPWASVFESLNINSCPIEVADYEVENMTLAADFAKDFMKEDYIGEYQVLFKLMNERMDDIACHVLSVIIKKLED